MKCFSDDEYLVILQNQIDHSPEFLRRFYPLSALPCDDQYMYKVLTHPKRLRFCLCGGAIRHDIKSYCAGHGEFPRYVIISCARCGVSIESCLDYGGSYDDAFTKFIQKTELFAKIYGNNSKDI